VFSFKKVLEGEKSKKMHSDGRKFPLLPFQSLFGWLQQSKTVQMNHKRVCLLKNQCIGLWPIPFVLIRPKGIKRMRLRRIPF